jgi:hypothetical protein
MSFTERLVLWLHIGFAIFTIGPGTIAIMSTPRYIRARNLTITTYLYRITRIFAVLSLFVIVFGIVLAQLEKKISQPWVTASLTLFIVALVLLVLIMRDQHRAIVALEATAAESSAGGADVAVASGHGAAAVPAESSAKSAAGGAAGTAEAGEADLADETGGASGNVPSPAESSAATTAAAAPASAAATAAAPADSGPGPVAAARRIASVERGRITSMGGIVAAIWLVVLVLMVWNGS